MWLFAEWRHSASLCSEFWLRRSRSSLRPDQPQRRRIRFQQCKLAHYRISSASGASRLAQDGCVPLHLAASHGCTATVLELVRSGARVDSTGRVCRGAVCCVLSLAHIDTLGTACRATGHLYTLRPLRATRPWSPSWRASAPTSTQRPMCERRSSAGHSRTSPVCAQDNDTPLHLAVESGRLEVVAELKKCAKGRTSMCRLGCGGLRGSRAGRSFTSALSSGAHCPRGRAGARCTRDGGATFAACGRRCRRRWSASICARAAQAEARRAAEEGREPVSSPAGASACSGRRWRRAPGAQAPKRARPDPATAIAIAAATAAEARLSTLETRFEALRRENAELKEAAQGWAKVRGESLLLSTACRRLGSGALLTLDLVCGKQGRPAARRCTAARWARLWSGPTRWASWRPCASCAWRLASARSGTSA
jgi:hypothetical protein